ncbi:DUF1273 family protein [Clostridiales bacterium]|nr:DUF1273 family protein [Clostridiales bacterium]
MRIPRCETARVEQNTVCFTGHRQIDRESVPEIRQRLKSAIHRCYEQGARWFICGGALGFDTLAAEEVLAFRTDHPDIGLFLAIPCADQSSHWSVSDRRRYERIRNSADDELVLAPSYFKGCMHVRNRFMVRHSSICICYLREFEGGTGYTVRYALSASRDVINLYPDLSSPALMKEQLWNCTFTSPSVSGSAHTVRSLRFPAAAGRKWSVTSLRFSRKHSSGSTK